MKAFPVIPQCLVRNQCARDATKSRRFSCVAALAAAAATGAANHEAGTFRVAPLLSLRPRDPFAKPANPEFASARKIPPRPTTITAGATDD
jgi:hypothetical protein